MLNDFEDFPHRRKGRHAVRIALERGGDRSQQKQKSTGCVDRVEFDHAVIIT